MKKLIFILAAAVAMASCSNLKSVSKNNDFGDYRYLVYDDVTFTVYRTNAITNLPGGRIEFTDQFGETISCMNCTSVERLDSLSTKKP